MTTATLRFATGLALDLAISKTTRPDLDRIFLDRRGVEHWATGIEVHDPEPEEWEPRELSLEAWPYGDGPKFYLLEFEGGNITGPWRDDSIASVEGIKAAWEWKHDGGTEGKRIADEALNELLEKES